MWLASRPSFNGVSLTGTLSASFVSSVSWASHSACAQSLSEAKRVVQVPVFVDPGHYRPVRPKVNPSLHREIQHRGDETVPIVESFAKKHETSRRENDVFVRRLASTNTDTLDEHRVALVPTFSSLQTTVRRLGNPDESNFRERYDLMSVTLIMGLLTRRHPVALRFVSADLPARMTQHPCPDRLVRAKIFTTAKAHLAIRTNRPSLFLNSLDGTLSRIGC